VYLLGRFIDPGRTLGRDEPRPRRGTRRNRIRHVRRASAWILAAVLAAPAVLALAVPGVDIDALRCAIKCGHPVRSGAVCCPTDSGASWKTCRPDDSLLPGFAAAALGVLTPAYRIVRPSDFAGLTPEPAPAPRSSIDAPPDPVPLALS
jgi:hypothetical protein